MGSVDPVRKTAPKSQHPWRLFKGDDLTYPVEMFIHIMEFKNAQNPNGIGPDYENTGGENGVDPSAKLIKCVLGHIPDPKYSDAPDGDPPPSMNTPASIWKHKVVRDSIDTQGWTTLKENLLSEFGQGEKDYTLKEKLTLLQSVGKGPYEDSQAYLIRIRCLVSLLSSNTIPTGSIDELPGVNDAWVRVLFLFGLDDIDQNLVVEESDVKGLEEMCSVLALPEVKMIRRADDAMRKNETPAGTSPVKRKRKAQNYAESDDEDTPLKRPKGRVKIEKEDNTENSYTRVNIKVEPTFEEQEEKFEEDYWGDGLVVPPPDDTEDEKPKKGKRGRKKGSKNKPKVKKGEKVVSVEGEDEKPVKTKVEKKEKKKKYGVYEQLSAQVIDSTRDETDSGPLHEIPQIKMVDLETGNVIGWKCAICNSDDTQFKKKEFIDGWELGGSGAKEKNSDKGSAKKRFEEHIADVHQGKKFHCHLCPFLANDAKDLVQHLWVTHSVKCVDHTGSYSATYLRCTYSDCSYRRTGNSWNAMGHHIARVHMKILPKKLSCTEGGCGQEYILFLDFHEHMSSKHEIEPIATFENCFNRNSEFDTFSCHLCVFKTCAQKLLDQHMFVNHTDGIKKARGHQCFDCGKMFTSNPILKVHWETTHAPCNLTCELCPESPSKKKMYTRLALQKHKQHMHRRQIGGQSHQCSRCDRHFPIISKLVIHFREQHLKYRRYQCKVCNNKLSTLSNARYHYIETHCKEIRAETGKIRMSKLPETFWDEHDTIEDLADKDVNYPKDDYIKALVVAEIQMNLQRETQRETPMEPSEAERRLLEESRKAEEASVKSVQVANPLLFPTNPFARHHHQN